MSVALCAAFQVRRSTIVFAFDIFWKWFLGESLLGSSFYVQKEKKKHHNILPDSLVCLFEAFFSAAQFPIMHIWASILCTYINSFFWARCAYILLAKMIIFVWSLENIYAYRPQCFIIFEKTLCERESERD